MNTQQELDQINAELQRLLLRGSNDENLVNRKRELEKIIRNGSSRDTPRNHTADTGTVSV